MTAFAEYNLAIAAILVLVLAALLQGFLSAYAKIVKGGQPPGIQASGDHSDPTFRVYRTHMNSVESLPVMLGATVFAMLAGASPFWVNLLVCVHLLARLVFWYVYVKDIGKIAGGPRTIAFVIGWLSNLLLAVIGLMALA